MSGKYDFANSVRQMIYDNGGEITHEELKKRLPEGTPPHKSMIETGIDT